VVLSATDTGLKKELTETEKEVERLEKRLEGLHDSQDDTGIDRFIDLTNDLTYATSGAIDGLETLGYVTYEQSEAFRKAETVMQLMLVPYELYTALNTYAISTEIAHTQSLIAQTAATTTATTATWGFNTALLANPITLIILGVIALVAALVALQLKFDILNKTLILIENMFKGIKNTIKDVVDAFENLRSKTDILSMVMKATPVGMAMELSGGIR
jgi:hypothetical protein